jgi:Fic family protein
MEFIMSPIIPLQNIKLQRFESPSILKKLTATSRKLAELKGVATSIPNQSIIINTLILQEAKDSSAIENIVTTHDDLFKNETFPESFTNLAAKEVLRYRQALKVGFETVRQSNLLTNNQIIQIQAELEQNNAGFRKLPGTSLKDGSGRVVYMPPQEPTEIINLMRDLEQFINDESIYLCDPLIKMALIHHQFESIHPFYDGNGRTGRIINILYLVKEGLLDMPILYLSNYIVRHKAEYYNLLQTVREHDAWEEWVLYMLAAVEETAQQAIITIRQIMEAIMHYKHEIRAKYSFYSQDLINNLFSYPYTKIAFIEKDLKVSRLTATKYLEKLAADGFLKKQKVGRVNYYINEPLLNILVGNRD